MIPLEPLFCPCCTPAMLHALAQADLTQMSRQFLMLGSGALTDVIQRSQPHSPYPKSPQG